MTDAFGIENKTNDQRISIIVGQLVIQLIAPQPSGLPGAQVVKHHADHVGSLTSSRDKLKVLQDDTREPREQLVEQLARAQILLEQTIEQIDVVSPFMASISAISFVLSHSFCSPSAFGPRTGMIRKPPSGVTVK